MPLICTVFRMSPLGADCQYRNFEIVLVVESLMTGIFNATDSIDDLSLQEFWKVSPSSLVHLVQSQASDWYDGHVIVAVDDDDAVYWIVSFRIKIVVGRIVIDLMGETTVAFELWTGAIVVGKAQRLLNYTLQIFQCALQ